MFEQIADIIILVAAVVAGITKICEFFGKPIKFLKKKQKEELREDVNEILDEALPTRLAKLNFQKHESCVNNKEACAAEVEQKVSENTVEAIKEIKNMVSELKQTVDILKDGSKDVLRQKIMTIYHTYKKERKMPLHAREALDELYKDYKKEGGNSYIDKYYKRMGLWKTDYSEDEDYMD